MKKVVYFVLVVGVLCAIGCKKSKTAKPTPSAQQDNSRDSLVGMDATVNGVPWRCDSAVGYRINYKSDSGKYDLMVTATEITDSTTSTITFTLSDFNGVGNYVINPPLFSATYYLGNQRYYSTSGNVTVTEVNDKSIIGTFQFVAGAVEITAGTFNVALP